MPVIIGLASDDIMIGSSWTFFSVQEINIHAHVFAACKLLTKHTFYAFITLFVFKSLT
jgi:hypothetical protein